MMPLCTHAHPHVHVRTSPLCTHATSCGTHAHQVYSSYSLLLTLCLLSLRYIRWVRLGLSPPDATPFTNWVMAGGRSLRLTPIVTNTVGLGVAWPAGTC